MKRFISESVWEVSSRSILRFDFDWSRDRPSWELFDSLYEWLKNVLVLMCGAAVTLIVAGAISQPPWPSFPFWPLFAIWLLVTVATLGIAVRFLFAAGAARAREAAYMGGVGGIVERHGLGLGIVAAVAVVILTVAIAKLFNY